MNKKILLIIGFSLVLFLILLSGIFSETKAQEFQTLASCDNIRDNNIQRVQCYSIFAKQTNDVNLCFKGKTYDGYEEGECVTSVAIQNKDVLVCNQINTTNIPQNSRGDTLKDKCTAQVAITINGSAVCNSLNTEYWKNFCYEGMRKNSQRQAVQIKNSSLCTGIYREGCYQQIGFDFKNYLSNFDFFLYWSKIFLYRIGMLLSIALVFYSYYRQIKNSISFQSHFSKLTIVGLIATILLGISMFLLFTSTTSLHGPPPPTFILIGISLLLLSILGALMVFKKPKSHKS